MPHSLVAFLSIACFAGTLPLAAHAANRASLAMPRPLASNLNWAQSDHSLLRVNSGTSLPSGASHISPTLFGPDVLPQWKTKGQSGDFVTPRLKGEHLQFR